SCGQGLGLDTLRVRRELTDLEHDVAVEVVRLAGDAVLGAVLAERTDRVRGAARRGAVLDVPVPAVGHGTHLYVRRGEVHPDGRHVPLGRLDRVEVVVDRVLLAGRTDRAHVRHGPLLLRAIDRVEQV